MRGGKRDKKGRGGERGGRGGTGGRREGGVYFPGV